MASLVHPTPERKTPAQIKWSNLTTRQLVALLLTRCEAHLVNGPSADDIRAQIQLRETEAGQ